MSVTKARKLILGVVSCWPAVYMLVFMLVVNLWAFFDAGHGGRAFAIVALFHLLTILATIALLVWYIRYVFATNRLPADKKALWATVLLLGNALAMPVFFWLYVWPDAPDDQRAAAEKLTGVV